MTDRTSTDRPTPNDIRETARSFIAAAFTSLSRDHVIPTPIFHPYIAIGRDYFGQEMPSSEFEALEEALETAHPERFADPLSRENPEFANAYIFSLLEACVSRCGICGHPFEVESPPIEECVTELLTVLDSPAYQMVCCREVSHLTTMDGSPAQLGEVTVIPETDTGPSSIEVAAREVPGTVGTFDRDKPRHFDPPKSMVVIRQTATEGDPFALAGRLTAQMERFLLLIRLLYAATAHSYWQVCGTSTLVSRVHPILETYVPPTFMAPLVRRTTRLSESNGDALTQLGSMLDNAVVKREGMATTSFDVALDRFVRAHRVSNAFDAIIDLATALEAVLTGNESETEAISLRLRSRAAALLATDEDRAEMIFGDLSKLYGLRSQLLHGGNIKEKDLRRDITKVSTIPDDAPFGMAVAYAVDRMRDLVRRAVLARLCLAAEPDPLWPFDQSVPVDSTLSDDAQRVQWRARWQAQLREIGAEGAAERARPGVDLISREDR